MDNWLMIFGMMAVTFIPRYLPLALSGRFRIHPLLAQALEFIPIAVLTAIIAQASFIQDGQVDFGLDNPYLYGALSAGITAWFTKHTFKTIIVGLIVYAIAYVVIN